MPFNIGLGIIFKSVVVHEHAIGDIRQVAAVSLPAAAEILVVLEQLKADPQTTIEKLTTKGDNDLGAYRLNVKPWQSTKGIANLWRLRILDTPATSHRIIYGYHWQTYQLCVLAVVHKEKYDYDDLTSEINKRIITDWNSI